MGGIARERQVHAQFHVFNDVPRYSGADRSTAQGNAMPVPVSKLGKPRRCSPSGRILFFTNTANAQSRRRGSVPAHADEIHPLGRSIGRGRLIARYPTLQIAGVECPPFRKLTEGEEIEFAPRSRKSCSSPSASPRGNTGSPGTWKLWVCPCVFRSGPVSTSSPVALNVCPKGGRELDRNGYIASRKNRAGSRNAIWTTSCSW